MSTLPMPRGPHPSPEELRLARRGPRDPKAERVLEHAALCARCAEEEYRLDAFERPEGVTERDVEQAWRRLSGERPRRIAPWRPLALAAMLLLAVGTIFVSRHGRESDALRGGSPGPELESPAGLLAEPPAAFRFAPVVSGPVRVRVFDATRSYEWTSDPATDGRVAFPAEEQKKLRPGVEYFWTLLGADVAARSFRLRP